MKIDGNSWKYMKVYEKSMKSMNMHGINLFWKKKMGYILYSKNINASHICPPKRNELFKQRSWKSTCWGKWWLWPAKCMSKSLFVWKLEMIPRSLRTFCHKRFPLKAQQKVSFWQKCWNPIFYWTSTGFHYYWGGVTGWSPSTTGAG